ncbi:DUF1501 domain-containing protein [Roseinatronobacter sp. NSM]|uniref:DUF1501 domain-containing protein n=1 Tax=Roseinatronobacter sp. NSM TaxID=3457785 RepID=UPI00403626D2
MAYRMNRRQLLTRALALGCSAAASPLVTPMSFAALPGDRRLVVIVLRGAMDGLDVFRPVGDRHLARLRPYLAQENPPLALDNFFALHPALSGLMPLWQAGEMAFVPATSTLYRDQRSHFDGQDHLEAGTAGILPPTLQRDGWLNRLVAQLPGAQARTAFALGRERMLILEGQAAITQWSPGTDLDLGPQNRLLLSYLFQNDPLFAEAGQIALDMTASGLDDDDDMPAAGDATGLGAYVARQLLDDARIASFSLTGWDTHRDQHRALLPALGRLQDAIVALRDGLGRAWGETIVMAMTEFGRTARENGARGTDHGTGGALLLAGGALRGGRAIGGWPGLSDQDLYAGRDLMPLSDIRAYPAWAMHDLFGLPVSSIERHVFARLDMGDSPRLFL